MYSSIILMSIHLQGVTQVIIGRAVVIASQWTDGVTDALMLE